MSKMANYTDYNLHSIFKNLQRRTKNTFERFSNNPLKYNTDKYHPIIGSENHPNFKK